MELKDKYDELIKNDIFLEYKRQNKNSYLAHIFRLFDKANENIWQFGFYNTDDSITTFIVQNDDIKEVPEQEIFKKNKKKLAKLELSEVKFSFLDAIEKAKKLQGEKYKQHPIMKIIVILQNLEQRQVFNITFVTQTFGTLNIHIDAITGEIISDKFTSLMELAKIEKGEKNPDTNYIG